MPDPSPASLSAAPAAAPSAIDWAAGAALGLLLGLLVGLSATPVVSAVVTGLVALLAAMFGLSDKLPLGLSRAGAHRLTAFALAAAVALLAGLQLRTRWLAPDVAELRRQLAEIEITDPAEQKQMLRFLRFGLLPAGTQAAGKDGEAAKLAVAAALPLLYSDTADFCTELRGRLAAGAVPADLLLQLRTGSEAARRAGAAIAARPTAEQAALLAAAPHYLCAP
jgi:hypothetical protein